MSSLTRRQLLMFFGASAGAAVLSPELGERLIGGGMAQAQTAPLSFTPMFLPSPLPIYRRQASFLPTGINGAGSKSIRSNPVTTYTVVDDVHVPPEYERYVIVAWGDRVFPNAGDYFGYNNDYTAFVPLTPGNVNDGYLWVNHEYVGFPLSTIAPEAPADVAASPSSYVSVTGNPALPTGASFGALSAADKQRIAGEFFYNMGGSVVRITRPADGRFTIAGDKSINRRIHGLSGLGVNSTRTDGYGSITSWGPAGYQIGDNNYLEGTGPAVADVFVGVNADGLGNKIIGTAYNCSGGYTPWGTVLTCEENYQASAGAFYVGVTEGVKSNGSQVVDPSTDAKGYTNGTTGQVFGLLGEKYGWSVEIDPADPNFRPKKHTWLGRFRHENVAFRAEAGNKLIAYQGDDRRGGHTWKYVSTGTVTNPTDKANSNLFTAGTLYVARFEPNGTGRWIPLALSTPTDPLSPSILSSAEAAGRGGTISNNGLFRLPRRVGIAGQTIDGGSFSVTVANEATALPGYRGKTLANFYTSQGAMLCDAFHAANLAGGTPTARPEDVEIHPVTKEVFVAYTDGAPGGDGYPDSRIFQVAKYSSAVNDAQQSGSILKIIEDSANGAGTTFRWQKINQGGESGSIGGAGWANVDNLAFDPLNNIWGVTDMSTTTHNGFATGAAGTPSTINHTSTGNVSAFTGVFGNNWLFCLPTGGPNAGQVLPFSYGPVRCEMTGPTFVGNTLLIAVQHPGEDSPIGDGTNLTRSIEMLNLSGTTFNQTRNVPRGSNWPSNIGYVGVVNGTLSNNPPRPAVTGIRRLAGSRFI